MRRIFRGLGSKISRGMFSGKEEKAVVARVKAAEDSLVSSEAEIQKEVDRQIEENQTKAIEQFNSGEELSKVIETLDQPTTIISSDLSLFTQDPRRENRYWNIAASESGTSELGEGGKEDDLVLRMRDNEKAFEVLSRGKFDLSDPKLSVTAASVSSLLVDGKETKAVSLGAVELMGKDAISIQDIDPKAIPAHLEVVLSKNEYEVVLLGKKVPLEESESPQSSQDPNIQQIDPQTFVEKKMSEFVKEELNTAERMLGLLHLDKITNWAFYLLPLLIFLSCVVYNTLQLRGVVKAQHKIDKARSLKFYNMKQRWVRQRNLEIAQRK